MKYKLLSLLSIAGILFPALSSGFELRLGEAKNELKIDGKISKDEYSGGVRLFGTVSNQKKELTYRRSEVALARDQKAFYLAISSEMDLYIKPTTGDIADFEVIAPNGKKVRVQINAQKFGNIPKGVTWKTVANTKEFVTEIAIPWSMFGVKPENNSEWKVKFIRMWLNPYEISKLDGKVIFDDSVPGFEQLHGKTNPTFGSGPQLFWNVTNQTSAEQKVKCDATITWIGNPELIQSETTIPAGKKHKFSLATTGAESDARTVDMTLSANGKTLLKRNYTWSRSGLRWINANPHIGFAIATYPTLKKAKARIYCAKEKNLDPFAEVRFQIVSTDGKKVFYDKAAPRSKDKFHLEWDIRELPHGDYKMFAVMKGKDGKVLRKMETKFQYRTFPWVNNKIGLERVVIPPFKPLTVKGNQVNATLTGYELGGNGLFDKVFAKGENILTGPVALKINGKTLAANNVKFQEKSADRVLASAKMDSPETAVELSYDIDYDGFILMKLKFQPKSGNFNSMTLEIPYKKAYAELLHSVAAQLRRNPSVKLDQKTGVIWDNIRNSANYFRPYIWLGGIEKGFSWLCESEKNWSLDRKKPMAEVIRSANGDAVLRIHIMNKPVTRKNAFEIEMGFQASPVKPMMPNYRKYSTVTVDGYVVAKSDPSSPIVGPWMYGSDYRTARDASFYPCGKDYSFVEYLTRQSRKDNNKQVNEKAISYLKKHNVPESHFKNMRSHMWHAAVNLVRPSKRSIVYINPRSGDRGMPEFGTYQSEWRNDQFQTGLHGLYFQNPVKSYRDFLVPLLRELVRHGFDGIYFDNTFDSVNLDDTMGPAEEIGLNLYRHHHTMLEMRYLIKRTATMLYTEKKMIEDRPYLTVHMTNSAVLPVLSFASHQLNWEAYYGNSDYQDRFSEGYILTESTGLQSGCVPQLLINYGTKMLKNQQTALALLLPYTLMDHWIHSLSEPFRKTVNAIRNFGYAEKDTKVYPCYDPENPLKITGKVRAAVLVRGQEALIMAGDFGSNGSFLCDISKLGFKNPVALDALTGEEIGKGNVLKISIPHHFSRLIIVGDGTAAEAALIRCSPSVGKIRKLQSGNYTPEKLFHLFSDKPQTFRNDSARVKQTLKEAPVAYSFVLWAKPVKGDDGGSAISMNSYRNFIGYSGKTTQFSFICYGNDGAYRDIGRYKVYCPPEKWHFVAGTVNPVSGEITLYINGKKAAQTVSKKACFPSKEIVIGGRTGNPKNFCGELGDVRMYNMPLSAEMIEKLYKEELPKYQGK